MKLLVSRLQQSCAVRQWNPEVVLKGSCVTPKKTKKKEKKRLITHCQNMAYSSNSIKLLAGNSHPELAQLVASRYVQSLGSSLLS